ncbi:MAG TPA: hypothetical protein VIK91_20650 [Nannocystis sp.]
MSLRTCRGSQDSKDPRREPPTPVPGADYYQLFERLDPDGEDVQIGGGDLVDTALTLTVPLHLRHGARYVLRACNDVGCTDSEPRTVLDSMAAAIGYIKASNTGEDDSFGYSVALSADGQTLAVGATGESSALSGGDIAAQINNGAPNAGAVYVFTREGGTWAQQAYIKAFNPGAGDYFGQSVALSADGLILAVGAPEEDGIPDNPNADTLPGSGAVYVFARDGDGHWSQQAYLKAANAGAGDKFGHHVALSADGKVLAVSAPWEDSAATDPSDDSVTDAGAVYVFEHDAQGWEQQAYLKPAVTQPDATFGAGLALSADGKVLAVGAERETDNNALYAGGVYIFSRHLPGDPWTQTKHLRSAYTDDGDLFGSSVALSSDGSILVVGAVYENGGSADDPSDNSVADCGAAYVFVRDPQQGWIEQAYLKPLAIDARIRFGTVAISGSGDLIAVGAGYERGTSVGVGGDPYATGLKGAGAVYVFRRQGDTWVHHAYVKAPNPGGNDTFGGVALSAAGDVLAVSARSEDGSAKGVGGEFDDFTQNSGAVYLY